MKPLLLLFATASIAAADWPPAKSPVVPTADGYVAIPDVALSPSSSTALPSMASWTTPTTKQSSAPPTRT